jgi:hypothetical protein
MTDEKTSFADQRWTIHFSINDVLKIAAAIIVILSGLGGLVWFAVDHAYKFGKERGAEDKIVYDAAHRLGLEQLATKTQSAADELSQAARGFSELLATNDEYQTLKKNADESQTQNKEKEAKIQILISQVEALQTELEQYKAEKIYSVSLHESIKIPSTEITIGLLAINSGSATVNMNGDRKPVQAAEVRSIPDPKTQRVCTITITSINDSILKFSAKCEPVTQSPHAN